MLSVTQLISSILNTIGLVAGLATLYMYYRCPCKLDYKLSPTGLSIQWTWMYSPLSISPRSPLDIGSDQIHPFICTPVVPQKRGASHPTTTLHTTGQLAVSPPHLGLPLQEDPSSSRTQTQRQNSTKSARSQGRGPINEIYHRQFLSEPNPKDPETPGF